MPIAANPRPAATAVVLRDSAAGVEVFLVRRHERTPFMGGAHVFPGGRVEEGDREADPSWCEGIDEAVGRMPDVPPVEALAFHTAAARELFEEAGVLLARDRAGRFVALTDAGEQAAFARYRAEVHDGTRTLRAMVESRGLLLSLDALVPLAHWVTPPIDVRQFDTRFFVVRVPPEQTPAHDEQETTHSIWIPPGRALREADEGAIVLPPPTWTTLRELEPFRSVDDVLAWARQRPVVRRQPLFLEHDGMRLLVLPGDPLHPDPPGAAPVPDARFVQIEGRWRARHPGT
jgi:8-oxo-dGTP pyrophosphatase MutT (NUDIX family)